MGKGREGGRKKKVKGEKEISTAYMELWYEVKCKESWSVGLIPLTTLKRELDNPKFGKPFE